MPLCPTGRIIRRLATVFKVDGHGDPSKPACFLTCSKYSDTLVLKPWTIQEATSLEAVVGNGDKGSHIMLEEIESFFLDLLADSEDGFIELVVVVGSIRFRPYFIRRTSILLKVRLLTFNLC